LTLVVDTSAILAIAFAEQGADEAQRLSRGGLMGMANFIEFVTRGQEKGHSPESAFAILSVLQIDVVPVDRASADQALPLWTWRKRNLSLGDRLCIGLARARGLPVLTGDRRWKELDLGVNVVLFR
jgi:PIN domain nuclease of toxin-antitoxin system